MTTRFAVLNEVHQRLHDMKNLQRASAWPHVEGVARAEKMVWDMIAACQPKDSLPFVPTEELRASVLEEAAKVCDADAAVAAAQTNSLRERNQALYLANAIRALKTTVSPQATIFPELKPGTVVQAKIPDEYRKTSK